jgi:hypothetical protein
MLPMISLDVALFDRSDLNFAVVRVPDTVLGDQGMIDTIVADAVLRFRRPVVLMGAERQETYGREDFRGFLSYVNPARLPWTSTPLDI